MAGLGVFRTSMNAASASLDDSAVATSPISPEPRAVRVLLLCSLAALFLPTYWSLLHTVWADDEQAHGPIILAVSLWLLYRKWREVVDAPARPAPFVGWCMLVLGLAGYFIGRSQAIPLFEVASQIPIIAACVLLFRGWRTLRSIWFPLFFLIFMLPLPGVWVQTLTIPLKIGVSYVAEHLLFAAGYPIARSGVILTVGQYQLLVADACAGLHTMFSLEALGLLYMNLTGHAAFARNALLATMIIPISFCANVVRVMVLILITYHFGYEAGQGFLHGLAGMVLFITALMLILAVDSAIGWVLAKRRADRAA